MLCTLQIKKFRFLVTLNRRELKHDYGCRGGLRLSVSTACNCGRARVNWYVGVIPEQRKLSTLLQEVAFPTSQSTGEESPAGGRGGGAAIRKVGGSTGEPVPNDCWSESTGGRVNERRQRTWMLRQILSIADHKHGWI